MSTPDQDRATALCGAAHDITRQISALVDEINMREHPRQGGVQHGNVRKVILRMRDQITLLTGVVDDLDRLEAGGTDPA